MAKRTDPVYSTVVLEFTAAANEFCKYAEHASELKGDELLKILQRLLPYLYLKASLLPLLEPVFEEGNVKSVTESDWTQVHDTLKSVFGSANDFNEVFDEKAKDSEGPVVSSLAENMADIYQDLKNSLVLYRTGTNEVMNDAVWECRLNFEHYWGQILTNSLRAIHYFIYSGEETLPDHSVDHNHPRERDTSEWFISRRQKDYRENGKQ